MKFPSNSTSQDISRDAIWVAVLMLASRPLGVIREVAFAWKIGASARTDAFFAASAVVEVATDVIATGFLASAIIPVFTPLYHSANGHSSDGREDAWRAASLTLNCFGLASLGIIVIVEVLAPTMTRWMFPGFASSTAVLATLALRWLVPFLFLQIVATVLVGVLQSLGRFAYVAAIQLFQNVVVIAAIVLLAGRLGIYSAIAGVLVFGLLQLVLLGKSVLADSPRYSFSLGFRDPSLRSVLKLGGLTFAAYLLLDASYLANRMFGSLLPEGSISALAYAIRFKYVAVGIAAYPLATTLFPSLSMAAGRPGAEPREILATGVRWTILVTLPIVLLLLFERAELVDIVYHRGAFSSGMVQLTSSALAGYAIGVIPYGLCLLLQRYFLAYHRAAPALAAYGISLLVNIALSGPLIRKRGVYGCGLAYSLGEIAAAAVFLMWLSAPDRQRIVSGLVSPVTRQIILPAIAMAMILTFLPPALQSVHAAKFAVLAWEGVRVGAGLITYAGMMYVSHRIAKAKLFEWARLRPGSSLGHD